MAIRETGVFKLGVRQEGDWFVAAESHGEAVRIYALHDGDEPGSEAYKDYENAVESSVRLEGRLLIEDPPAKAE